MPDIRIGRRAAAPAVGGNEAPDQNTASNLLKIAGGVGASGLHRVGSVLSTPDRLLYGTLNGLMGLEGGYGNMNPVDSTGGIEASTFLENLGLHPKNDPNKWGVDDFTRFGINVLGSPMSWLGAGGLTTAGVKASKLAHVPMNTESFRNGLRGLVSVHTPWSNVSQGAAGTGAAVADALEATGKAVRAPQIVEAVQKSAPVRHFNALFRHQFNGKSHPVIQELAIENDKEMRAALRAWDRDIKAMAIKQANDKLLDESYSPILRDLLEQVPNNGATAAAAKHADEMYRVSEGIINNDISQGTRRNGLLDDNVRPFPRRAGLNIKFDKKNDLHQALVDKIHSRMEDWKGLGGTTNINRMLTDKDVDAAIMAVRNAGGSVRKQAQAAHAMLVHKFPGIKPEKLEVVAGKMADVDALRTEALFTNHPLIDLDIAGRTGTRRFYKNKLTFKAIAKAMTNDPTNGIKVKNFLRDAGFKSRSIAAGNIAGFNGKTIKEILNSYIDIDLAHQLHDVVRKDATHPSVKTLQEWLKYVTVPWKAATLAFPAARVRDAASGVVQNSLLNHGGAPGSTAWQEAMNILHGKDLAHDYSKIPEVADLIQKHGLTNTEAMRVFLATEAPRVHGQVADIAPNQLGGTLRDILNQVPGTTPSSVYDILKRMGKSFTHGELDAAGNPIGTGSVWNPINVTGVGGREATGFGPVAAANVAAGASDEFNRHAGILGQMLEGYNPSVAGARTRAAQVDYDPSTFTPMESYMRNWFPFYSFMSRMLGHTGKELATHPGGPTAQIVKEIDRSQARDMGVPDSVLDTSAIPLSTLDDGTRRFLTGFGLMHESPVQTLGSLASGSPAEVFSTLGQQLTPLAKMPIELATGRSLFQKGEPLSSLRPNIGQTLQDIGSMTGLRDPEAGPVTFPGSQSLENLVELSPASRLATTIRQLTDTRKGALAKAANTLTGARITDVSPEKQTRTMLKRAEKLAEAAGGRSRSEVYFSKKQLELLDRINPELAARQRAIQKLMQSLKNKPKAATKSGDVRVGR